MELEGRVAEMIRSLREAGHETLATLLARSRFRVLDDGRLEVAGSREFCSEMKSDRAGIAFRAIDDHLEFAESQIKVIYLPSAFALHLPDRR